MYSIINEHGYQAPHSKTRSQAGVHLAASAPFASPSFTFPTELLSSNSLKDTLVMFTDSLSRFLFSRGSD